MVKLNVGRTLSSAVDKTSVIVVRAPAGEVKLTCGGVEMYDPRTGTPTTGQADPAQMGGSLLGKRYVDDADTIELLCTKGGEGSLALDGSPLTVRAAKALPASD